MHKELSKCRKKVMAVTLMQSDLYDVPQRISALPASGVRHKQPTDGLNIIHME